MEHYITSGGVCAGRIDFAVTDGIVRQVRFSGGCEGNTSAVEKLAEGIPAEELISKLRGIRCGSKTTSCPDQLADALEQHMNKQNKN